MSDKLSAHVAAGGLPAFALGLSPRVACLPLGANMVFPFETPSLPPGPLPAGGGVGPDHGHAMPKDPSTAVTSAKFTVPSWSASPGPSSVP